MFLLIFLSSIRKLYRITPLVFSIIIDDANGRLQFTYKIILQQLAAPAY